MLSAQNRTQKINGDHTTLPSFTFQSHQRGRNKRRTEPQESAEHDVNRKDRHPRSAKASRSFLRKRGDEVLANFIRTTEEGYNGNTQNGIPKENGIFQEGGSGYEHSGVSTGSENKGGQTGWYEGTEKEKSEGKQVQYASSTSPIDSSQESAHTLRHKMLIQHKVMPKPSPAKSAENSQVSSNHSTSDKLPEREHRVKGYMNARQSLLGNRSDHNLRLKLSGYSKKRKQEQASLTEERLANSGTSSCTTDSFTIIPKANEARGQSHVDQETPLVTEDDQEALEGSSAFNSGHTIHRLGEQAHHTNGNKIQPLMTQKGNTPRDLDIKDGIGGEMVFSSRVDIRRLHRQQQAKAIADKTNGDVDKAPSVHNTYRNNKYASNHPDLSSTNGARETSNDSIELNTSATANTRQLGSINKALIPTAYKSPVKVSGRLIDCSHSSGGGHLNGGLKTQRTAANNGEIVQDNCIKDNKQKNSGPGNEIKSPANNSQSSCERGLDHRTLKSHKGKLAADKLNGHTERDYNETGHLEKWKSQRSNKQVGDRVAVRTDAEGQFNREYSHSSFTSGKTSVTSESEGGTPNSSASKLSDRLRRNIKTPILPNKSGKAVVRPTFGSRSHEVLSSVHSPEEKDHHTPRFVQERHQTDPREPLLPPHPPPVLTGVSSRNVYLSAQSCENFSNFRKDDFKSALQRLKSTQNKVTSFPENNFGERTPRNLKRLGQVSETEASEDFSEDSDVSDNDEPVAYHSEGKFSNRYSPRVEKPCAKIRKPGILSFPDKKLQTTKPYLAPKSQGKFQSSSLPNMKSDSQKTAMQALPSYAPPSGQYAQGKPVMKSASFDSFKRMKRKQHIDAAILNLNHAPAQQRKMTSNGDSEIVRQTGMLHSSSLSGFQKHSNVPQTKESPERPRTGYRRRIPSDIPMPKDQSEYVPSETESVSLFSDTCSTASGYSDNTTPYSNGRGYLETQLRSPGQLTKEGKGKQGKDNVDLFRPKSAMGRERQAKNSNNKGLKITSDSVFSSGNDVEFKTKGLLKSPSADRLGESKHMPPNIPHKTSQLGYLQNLQFEKSQEQKHELRPKSSKGRHRLSEPDIQMKSSSEKYVDEYNRRRISSDSRESIHHTSPVDKVLMHNSNPFADKKSVLQDKKSGYQHPSQTRDNQKMFQRPDILQLDSPTGNTKTEPAHVQYNKPQVDLDMDSGNDTDFDGEIEILDLDKLDNTSTSDDNGAYEEKFLRKQNGVRCHVDSTASSRSAGSETSSAWDNETNAVDCHGSSVKTHKQQMFHRQSDNTAMIYDRSMAGTPRLTPKEVAIVRERTEREINRTSQGPRLSPKANPNDTANSKRVMQKPNKSSKMYGASDVIDSNFSQHRNSMHKAGVTQYPSQGLKAIYKEESTSLILGKHRHKKLPDVGMHDNENDKSTNPDLSSQNSIHRKLSIKSQKKLQPIAKLAPSMDIFSTHENAQNSFHKSVRITANDNANNSNSTDDASLAGILTKPKRVRNKSRPKSEVLGSDRNLLKLNHNCLGNGDNDSPFDSCYSESPGDLTDSSLNLECNTKDETFNRRYSDF